MTITHFLNRFAEQAGFSALTQALRQDKDTQHIELRGLVGSAKAMAAAATIAHKGGVHLLVMNEKEDAAYMYNDLYNLLPAHKVLFFPSSYKRSVKHGEVDPSGEVQRTAVLSELTERGAKETVVVVSYPEAIGEKVVSSDNVSKNTLRLKKGEKISLDFITETLFEYQFERVDFVYEPGQFARRGSIVDIFSFAENKPFRLDFFGDEVETIRSFDLNTQLSVQQLDEVEIVPNLRQLAKGSERSSFLTFIEAHKPVLWMQNADFATERLAVQYEQVEALEIDSCIGQGELITGLQRYTSLHFAPDSTPKTQTVEWNTSPQPAFNKNFDLFVEHLAQMEHRGYTKVILSDNPMQAERLQSIVNNINPGLKELEYVPMALHEGFVSDEAQMACYTDHQLFARYHRYKLHGELEKSEQLTIQEFNSLQVGDYVVHIDHGIGIFGGLVKQMINGKEHEQIKLTYRDGDVLFVSVHGLHRIARYKGKEGEPPKVYKLGTGVWQKLKNNAKNKVKDIAKNLIALYAKRKEAEGYAYSPDSYLQHELEASFLYEDTPDQAKTTKAVKADMERSIPMDRLVCGDVGFGKTEIAIRAAFKTVTDGKQVAVLVPSTILALQHHKTFRKRLKEFPCHIEYISRFRTAGETRKILAALAEGKVDILIGTHKLLGKEVKFKDLGLLIIDEEQKFGVSAKEKLRELRLNVDTLTLTATPIPRTLQFSLMGARDLSVIQTPPPNRQPVTTELHTFDEEVIRDAIQYELSRGGQVYFVHNRIHDLLDIELLVRKLVPDARVIAAHGQMEGNEMERRVVSFIDGEHDVLIATSIVENGIDIPNANTIIINQAQNFGLSDLHQLRGRVGRSNRKAYCYLLAPPQSVLTSDARRRLKALEEFSDLGSGFNIAMQDLDIRGAGNLLGGEQSGFITEMGFETYQKILNEALLELREEGEWTEEPAKEQEEGGQDAQRNAFGITQGNVYVTDTIIETDMELLLPDEYVRNTAEKIRLYREIDNLQTEEEMQAFRSKLRDRFGPVPKPADDLIHVVRLRQLAMNMGFEKIILKNYIMISYFVNNPQSPYYQSPVFGRIMQQIANNALRFKVRENNNRLSFVAQRVGSVAEAMHVLEIVKG